MTAIINGTPLFTEHELAGLCLVHQYFRDQGVDPLVFDLQTLAYWLQQKKSPAEIFVICCGKPPDRHLGGVEA